MKKLTETINAAFFKAYPSTVDILDPAAPDAEDILCKRVKMLADDLDCTRKNFRVTNEEMVRLDLKLRHIRLHWWQFWRSPRGRT